MPEQPDSVHLTRRGIDYQKPQVLDFMVSFLRSKALYALLLLALVPRLGSAQDVQMVPDQQDKDSAAKAHSDKDPDEGKPVTPLRANVNVVQLFFNVKDKKGGLIPSLPKDNFEVFEDGKPQVIKYFAAESNLPLTLGILIDSIASQERALDMEKQVGSAFLGEIRLNNDMTFVMSI